ncbi:RNA polymerase subunit sigma [Methylophaga nitratireducenticrescens]|uniref:RNA polymerase n=1 Tax=Methylophaga nitratireducenticrescens TaxID=754476 RepID=I1XF77_METNJ|nr:sigma-70 family RNA polymerase sigma factor [Methylophaga nitratireducenticrescens]AFI83046.1 RNA polymerase subunit sigma [Methylophaga nitratireducenticrescens]
MTTSSIESLYKDHHNWLYGWLRSKLGCAHSAADLAHDTYVRVLTTGNVPQADDSRRYLSQIAKGLVIDLYRRRQIEAAYLETISHLPELEAPSAEMRHIIIETLLEIDSILQQLPEKVRRAFLLRQFDGLSYQQIAKQLNVSVSSIEKYIARALAACYKAMVLYPS